jgi:hypothetical protein
VRELEKQVNKVLGKPSPKQGEGENEMTDPLAAYWAELGWKVHYKGGSRWELEVDLGSGVAEQDLRKAMRDRLSALADTLKFKPQEQQKN